MPTSMSLGEYYIKKVCGRGALFAASVSLMEGGVERKLALGLVHSFFALSIGDNICFLSLPCLGGYHWLRTRRLLRLQKNELLTRATSASIRRQNAKPRRSTGREKPPRPCHITLSGRGVAPSRNPRVRYVILIIIANIRNEAGFRSRDPLRRKSEWTFAATPSPNRKPILRC